MKSPPTPIAGCSSAVCPKCGTSSPCVDHLEVDIGVGVQTGEHTYLCPTHGGFGYGSTGNVVFQDE